MVNSGNDDITFGDIRSTPSLVSCNEMEIYWVMDVSFDPNSVTAGPIALGRALILFSFWLCFESFGECKYILSKPP